MSDRLIPLFPLKLVLFPRTPLPLHIFEDRYRQMIGEAIESNSEFGIVQAQDEGIVRTGCSATVERVLRRYDDGRLDILCLGKRRFEVVNLDEERNFLRAEVQFFDDEDDFPAPVATRQAAITAFERLRIETEAQVLGHPDVDDSRLSFQLAQLVKDNDFRQVLLTTRSEAERLRQFTAFVPKYVESLKHATHLKKVAPLNGHGGVH